MSVDIADIRSTSSTWLYGPSGPYRSEVVLPEAAPLAEIPEPELPPAVSVDAPSLLRLDLGCGQNKKEGFTGVDFAPGPGVDVVHNLLYYPWPFSDDSVEEIHCSHFFEHVPGHARPAFMDEVWRVLKVGGTAFFVTPYWASERAVQDFTHEWPPVAAPSYLYFNLAWREANKLTHGYYDMRCDFDVAFPGQSLDGVWASRAPEALGFAAKHYINVVHDMWALLTKRAR